MKQLRTMLAIAVAAIGIAGFAGGITKDQAKGLVEKVCTEVEKDADGTFKRVIAAEHPYKNKDNPAFYVFVYDTDVKIVAHPKKHLVGRSYKGKPDVRGKKFRDEIVKTALEKGSGWVDYSYQKPGTTGIHAKTTFCKATKGSDGRTYVVCAGKYK